MAARLQPAEDAIAGEFIFIALGIVAEATGQMGAVEFPETDKVVLQARVPYWFSRWFHAQTCQQTVFAGLPKGVTWHHCVRRIGFLFAWNLCGSTQQTRESVQTNSTWRAKVQSQPQQRGILGDNIVLRFRNICGYILFVRTVASGSCVSSLVCRRGTTSTLLSRWSTPLGASACLLLD